MLIFHCRRHIIFLNLCSVLAIPESESDSEVDEGHEGTTILKLDDWVVFKLDHEAAQLILHLRQKWNALFLRRMKYPSKTMSQQDEQVIKTLVAVITNEELAYGLQQPSGIGQRPRPLIVDYYPANARRSEEYEDVCDFYFDMSTNPKKVPNISEFNNNYSFCFSAELLSIKPLPLNHINLKRDDFFYI